MKRPTSGWTGPNGAGGRFKVRSYSIFLHPETRQLFGYAEIESEERWAAIADTAVNRRWWAYMKDLMATNPDNSPVSVKLREVFHIENRLS